MIKITKKPILEQDGKPIHLEVHHMPKALYWKKCELDSFLVQLQ